MENTASILTIREVADLLRCSKAHVQKALVGKIANVPQLAHLSLGRRKLVRRDWLEQWMENSEKQQRHLRQRLHGTNSSAPISVGLGTIEILGKPLLNIEAEAAAERSASCCSKESSEKEGVQV